MPATLLIGAGPGGLAVSLDDEPGRIDPVPVLGGLDALAEVLDATGVRRVVITPSLLGPAAIADVLDACNARGVSVRIVDDPGAAPRGVRIEDLLSRDRVPPSLSLADLERSYGGKRIFVTGAGGSIGAELCRQLAKMGPAALILAERDETNLFEIDREIDLAIPLLLDLMDSKAVERAFRDHAPDVVFHAAAYKHVPMMEQFPWEAVRNNVFATRYVAELAEQHGVGRFVLVSTDKAINPTSVMGATKRLAEQIVQELAARSTTRFSSVRFGNVLGSRGSVVGIFETQIAAGGPVTVTHPAATRYFMTIAEAANLVIQAGTVGGQGEVLLLDMGAPVRIVDLARHMIRLAGFREDQIGIEVTGIRPGEKLFEELSTSSEDLSPTALRKIFRCKPLPVQPERLTTILDRLQFVVRARDADGIRTILAELEIGYQRGAAARATDA